MPRLGPGANGLPSEESVAYDEGDTTVSLFTWTEEGRVNEIERERTSADGDLVYRELLAYRYEDGRLIDSRLEDVSDESDDFDERLYRTDEAGVVTGFERYERPSGVLLSRAVYTDDEAGNLASAEEFDGSGAQTYRGALTYEPSSRPIYNRDLFIQTLYP